MIKSWPSLLAGGYWGFHRGKPVPFANRAPSWIFEARAPHIQNGGHEMRTPGFLAEEKLQRLKVGYAKLSQVYLLLVLENY